VLPLICYEAIFPQGVRGAPGRADWILQITNDAWFGTLTGPFQHLAQARLRAIEQGLPLVRVANTGVSAVIDAKGRVLAAIPLGEAAFLDRALPPALAATPYARWGDGPVLALLAAFAATLAFWKGRKQA
ncbi:MAG: apolipoprotein N-acyltransferase, partial [Cereibacter sp.]